MDWERLAQAVIDRRVALGHRTRESLAAATGLSTRVLADIENHRRDNYDRVTFARLETALKWEPGKVLEILTGTPPRVDARHFDVPYAQALADLVASLGLNSAQELALVMHIRRRMGEQHAELLREIEGMVQRPMATQLKSTPKSVADILAAQSSDPDAKRDRRHADH